MSSTHNKECREAILACLAQVPFGKVSSYGQIASLSGNKGKARYVAYILKHLPNNTTIPWHRIINAQGKISFPENSAKYHEQATRLQEEGIALESNKNLLRRYGWP